MDKQKIVDILLGFYAARNKELDSKAILSYSLIAFLLFFSVGAYVLHIVNAINHLSVYIMSYPIFLLGWFACMMYINYKMKLLWVYIEKIEETLCLLLKEDQNQLYPLPLWATSLNKRIKKRAGFNMEHQGYTYLVGASWSGFFVVLYYTAIKGYLFINASDFLLKGALAFLYLSMVIISFLIEIKVYLILSNRIQESKREDLFIDKLNK